MRDTRSGQTRISRKWTALAGAVGLAAATAVHGATLGQASGAGGTAAAPTTAAPATQPSVSELIQKINDLQSQLDQMKQQQQQQQAQQQQVSQQEIDDTVDRVLRDADKRSQLLQDEGFTAGFDHNRFFIGSADGNYLLRPWIHIQIRDGTAFRSHEKSDGDDDTQNGFELRRARLGFDGNLFTPDFTYLINWTTYRGNSTATVTGASGNVGTVSQGNGGEPVLEEAWVRYNFPDTPWGIRGGQMHDPLDHESIMGSKFRGPEISLTGDIFANTDTFTQAVTAIYDPKESFRFEGGVTDGERAANTNFEDTPNNGIQYDWGLAGRAEYKVMGKWQDYNQLTALGDSQDLLVFGLGVDNSQAGNDDQFSHTVDVQYGNPGGLFFYGSYFGRYTNHNKGIPNGAPTSTSFGTPGTPGKDTYEYSVLGQAAYLFDQKWEPYVRYEHLYLQGTPAGSQNNINEVSLGLNYYFHGHNAKLSGQAMYLPNGIPVNDDSNDVLISNNHQEFVFIAQFQLLL
jgi:hypothetical protein